MSDLGYRWKNNSKPFHWEASVYYGRFKDWIQWQPNSLGLWQPFNILKVKTYGLESTASWQKEWKDWKTKISATYSYNISENEDTQKQLIYTPKNNVSIRSQFDFNKWFLSFFYTYHSSRFTTSNNSQSLEGNGISQLNLGYQTSALKLPISTIFSIQNVSNLEYESVKGYYMPGRNYQLSCQLKF